MTASRPEGAKGKAREVVLRVGGDEHATPYMWEAAVATALEEYAREQVEVEREKYARDLTAAYLKLDALTQEKAALESRERALCWLTERLVASLKQATRVCGADVMQAQGYTAIMDEARAVLAPRRG